jgi:hypothetical protein
MIVVTPRMAELSRLAGVDMRRLARDERADLAAFLTTLPPEQWQAPALCARWLAAARDDHWQAGRSPGGESSVQVGCVAEAQLLQVRCRQAGLISLLTDEDDAQVPAGDGGVPPLGRGVATPFQAVAGQHDGAGDQAVFAALVVAADVDQQSATGLGAEGLGGRWAAWQCDPGLGEQLVDGLGARRRTMSGLLDGGGMSLSASPTAIAARLQPGGSPTCQPTCEMYGYG